MTHSTNAVTVLVFKVCGEVGSWLAGGHTKDRDVDSVTERCSGLNERQTSKWNTQENENVNYTENGPSRAIMA